MSEPSEWVKVRHVLTFEQVFMRSEYNSAIIEGQEVPCPDGQVREWERSLKGGIRELVKAVVEGETDPVAVEVTVSAYDPRANSSPALDRLIVERMASFGIAPNEAGQAMLEGRQPADPESARLATVGMTPDELAKAHPLAPLDKDAQG